MASLYEFMTLFMAYGAMRAWGERDAIECALTLGMAALAALLCIAHSIQDNKPKEK